MYTSINIHTGEPVNDLAHFMQCASDVVTTPTGTRVMRRHYGSAVPDLTDTPDNASNRVRLIAATATALMRWEPRLALNRVRVASGATPGKLLFAIDGQVTIDNTRYTLDGALIGGRSKT